MITKVLYNTKIQMYSTNPYKVVIFNIHEDKATYVYSTEENKSYYLCGNHLVANVNVTDNVS